MRAAAKSPRSVAVAIPAEPRVEAKIAPNELYMKQQVLRILRIGELTWKRLKERGLKPIRIGNSLAVKGDALIEVLEKG